jgi:hypothetical protein
MDWESAYGQAKVLWESSSAQIVCPCGQKHTLDAESEPKKCKCGRSYRMTVSIQVKPLTPNPEKK